MDVLRCPSCGAPAPPSASTCAWCGGALPLLPPPPPEIVSARDEARTAIESASEVVLRLGWGLAEVLQVTDSSGALLARGLRSMEGLAGLMEMLLVGPSDQFLLAFRLRSQPGRPLIQASIPYLVVDDQGRIVGELLGVYEGLTHRTYNLMSDGVEYLKVPSVSRDVPYPVLQRGSQVALVTENRPFLAKPIETVWQMRFTAPCTHLHVLALLVHVASRWGVIPV